MSAREHTRWSPRLVDDGSFESVYFRPMRDRRNIPGRQALVSRVRSEFDEMPGLCLTTGAATKLFGIDGGACARVLTELAEGGLLECTPDGRYARRGRAV